ncbi:MAG: DUF4124 domain-containing protein [Deltaproteobacteria bacterium]|jgi:hypothetical protein|nr:DUF4124 domain-containing protein [Deltaproteobacteria bacterium]
MKLKYVLIVTVFYILSVASVSAEYYQWIDQDGIKHYTDDVSEIPEGQRPGLNIYKSIKTPDKKKPDKNKPDKKKNLITHESLVIKKDALDIEYDNLVKKKEALKEQKKSLGETKYNKLATELNIAIQEYQEKTDEYEILVEKYNKQIQPSEKNDLGGYYLFTSVFQ